jgi:hypothetical protein
MPVSAIARYRSGTIESATPLARKLKAVLLKHGAAYWISRFETGQNVAECLIVDLDL